MIIDALKYVVSLAEARKIEVEGLNFTDKPIHQVKFPMISGFNTTSLSSIVNYIVVNPDEIEEKLILSIESPTRVVLQTANRAVRNTRETLLVASPELPTIQFGRYMDVETFIIQMQSKFMRTDESHLLMRLVGNVREEKVKNTSDDGFSQAVTAKVGIARVEDVIVPNPINLIPFRTFLEVEQPESLFVFRMQDGPQMALFEADGGGWKYKAIESIKKYFEDSEALQSMIQEGNLTIIA